MQDNKSVINLIRKQLQGELINAAEQQKLEQWKADNSQSYELYEKIWSEAHHLKLEATTDASDQYEQFISRRSQRKMPYRYAAAAVISLLIMASAVFLFIKSGTEILSNEESSGYVSYTLDDGSKVWLNNASTLEIDRNFNKAQRTVKLSGEAYFEVASDENKPFIVRNKHSSIMVLGTRFNAIASDSVDAVFLIEGKVAFSKKGDTTKLLPGEKATATGSLPITKTHYSDENFLAWKTGKLKFENQSLHEIAKQLEKHYRIAFEFANEQVKHCNVTITFDNLSLDEALKELSFLLDIEFTKTDQRIITSGNGC